MCDSPALGIVPDRTAATLLPILQQHLRSGTTVNSDQWAAYNRVHQLRSVNAYHTVNHSLHFVDPGTGDHTQNVGNKVKGKFKRMKGVHEEMLSSYLGEFMWRERHGRTASTALTNLFRDINLRYIARDEQDGQCGQLCGFGRHALGLFSTLDPYAKVYSRSPGPSENRHTPRTISKPLVPAESSYLSESSHILR